MKEIPLTQGKVALVDDEDFEWLNQWKWYFSDKGYAYREQSCHKVHMHTLILQTPPGLVCDHINRNRLDNRRCNLRTCYKGENSRNRGHNSNNTSGYKGVGWATHQKMWRARIMNNRKMIHLGYFKNQEDAAKAYDSASTKYFGDFSSKNFAQEAV